MGLLTCIFDSNRAELWGGAIYQRRYPCTLTIDGCEFRNGLANDGGALNLEQGKTEIRDSVFTNNYAEVGLHHPTPPPRHVLPHLLSLSSYSTIAVLTR